MNRITLTFILINILTIKVILAKNIEAIVNTKNVKDMVISRMIEETLNPYIQKDTQKNILSTVAYIPVLNGISSNMLNSMQYQEIVENKKLIKRIEEETKVLGLKINQNDMKILEIHKVLNKYNNRFVTFANEFTDVNKYIQINHKEINDIKNGVFIQALNTLNKYVNNIELNPISRRDFLSRAANGFETTNAIKNKKVSNLSNYYLIYVNNEFYKETKANVYFNDMVNGFDRLIVLTDKDELNLKLLNLVYINIANLEENKLIIFRNKLENITKKIIIKKVKNKKFEDALMLGRNYQNITNQKVLFELAKKYRIQNRDDIMKLFSSVTKVLELIEFNQNNLLNAEAVRYLYKNSYIDNAVELLKTQNFDDDFRLKAFKSILIYLEDKDKLKEVNELMKKYSTI